MIFSQKILDTQERRLYHTTPHHRFVSYILEWINHESTFLFWLFVFNVTSSGFLFLSFWGSWKTFVHEVCASSRNAALVFIAVLFTALVIYTFFRKLPFLLRAAKILLLAVSVPLFAIDIFTLWHYQTPFNEVMMEIALMTNPREGSEFLMDFLFQRHFLTFAAGIIILLAVLRKIYSLIQRHMAVLVSIIVIIVMTGIAGIVHLKIVKNYSVRHTLCKVTAWLFAPARWPLMASKLHRMHEAYQAVLSAAPSDVEITSSGRGIPYVVFILGEATSRNHMQLYGYNLPTTPKLSARKDIHVFSDVISPHAVTIYVMHKIFTFYRYGMPGEWFTYTSLFRILKEAGCHTAWMSNQEFQIGGEAVRLYSVQCDSAEFTEKHRVEYDKGKFYDGALLEYVDEAMKSRQPENFYLIHLMGTHVRYIRRYPPEYEKFSANDEAGLEGISRSQKQTRAEYDNAVLYNDFVVDEIIKRFENENAIVIYVSDHGEEVCDIAATFGHHDGIIDRNMIEIPMIIWTSQKFRQSYLELEARIASSVNRPYMTDDMIHTVLDIMGIETPEYDSSKSVINPKFDSSRKRIYAGMQYDKDKGLHEIQ